jgi:AraC-like DNA-binding protein
MNLGINNEKQYLLRKFSVSSILLSRYELNEGEPMYIKKIAKSTIPITSSRQAIFPYGKQGFPCQLYSENINNFNNSMVESHWHLELEFGIVEEGMINLFVHKNVFSIHENEGYIILPTELHQVKKADNQPGIVKTIIINPKIIYGDSKSILFHKYYLPVINTISDGMIMFNNHTPHNKNIRKELNDVIQLLTFPCPKYELEIYKCFINIWSYIYDSMQKSIYCDSVTSEKDQKLLKKILQFIGANYLGDISLNDLSKSGNISKSECNRLFQRTLSCSPFEYLINFRISKSQEYLSDEKYSITDIAGLVGFNSVNYYTTVFKKHLGYTPTEYKKMLS